MSDIARRLKRQRRLQVETDRVAHAIEQGYDQAVVDVRVELLAQALAEAIRP